MLWGQVAPSASGWRPPELRFLTPAGTAGQTQRAYAETFQATHSPQPVWGSFVIPGMVPKFAETRRDSPFRASRSGFTESQVPHAQWAGVGLACSSGWKGGGRTCQQRDPQLTPPGSQPGVDGARVDLEPGAAFSAGANGARSHRPSPPRAWVVALTGQLLARPTAEGLQIVAEGSSTRHLAQKPHPAVLLSPEYAEESLGFLGSQQLSWGYKRGGVTEQGHLSPGALSETLVTFREVVGRSRRS